MRAPFSQRWPAHAGYSALSDLAHLPIAIVKIDRSFVLALQQARLGSLVARRRLRQQLRPRCGLILPG